MIEDVAAIALKDIKVRPHFPVYFSPRDPVGFSYKGHKLLEVPGTVDNMLGSNLTVIIDISFGFVAVKHLALPHSKQLVAVGALVEVVVLFLQQQL
jgi:hypothetical protein